MKTSNIIDLQDLTLKSSNNWKNFEPPEERPFGLTQKVTSHQDALGSFVGLRWLRPPAGQRPKDGFWLIFEGEMARKNKKQNTQLEMTSLVIFGERYFCITFYNQPNFDVEIPKTQLESLFKSLDFFGTLVPPMSFKNKRTPVKRLGPGVCLWSRPWWHWMYSSAHGAGTSQGIFFSTRKIGALRCFLRPQLNWLETKPFWLGSLVSQTDSRWTLEKVGWESCFWLR